MKDHPASQQPPETVRHDLGGWISGSSVEAEAVAAGEIEPGDILLLDSGIQAEVTDVRDGFYRFPSGREMGVAIGWKLGTSSGLLFRRASDMLQRLAGQP